MYVALDRNTFVMRAVALAAKRIRSAYCRIPEICTMTDAWVERHAGKFGFAIALSVFAVLLYGFVWASRAGRVTGDESLTSKGMLMGIGTLVSGLASFLLMLVTNALIRIVAVPMLVTVLTIIAVPYFIGEVLLVMAKLIVLIPLICLFLGTRLHQLWQRIFFTCPLRECHYRGLPRYVCPKCGASNSNLWPNLYGLFWHQCVNCSRFLPTLDFIGRSRLQKHCGRCDLPLLGKHAGRVPERLVAIVGGPGSGKTNYLLMTAEALQGPRNGQLHLKIDDPGQQSDFDRTIEPLRRGIPSPKTAKVKSAFMLYGKISRVLCQLYLYDAPGEEFSSLTSMTEQRYFPLLEGVILLVDPDTFEANSGVSVEFRQSLQMVVAVLARMVAVEGKDASMKRVAVVISKADLECVKSEIGDLRNGPIDSQVCRGAIVKWGGENALRALEHRFKNVHYFACSPLGRAAGDSDGQPFHGIGLLDPLQWVLSGNHN